MSVPNAGKAIIRAEKLRDYLLAPSHSVGRSKAFFFRRLGFSRNDWKTLEAGLRDLLQRGVVEVEEGEFGMKYVVSGSLAGPNGISAEIVTVWIILSGGDTPIFVMAYPGY